MRFKKSLSCISKPHLTLLNYNYKLQSANYLFPLTHISEIPRFLHTKNKRIDKKEIYLFDFRSNNYKAIDGKEDKNISFYLFSMNKYNEIISPSYKLKGDFGIKNNDEENLKPKYLLIYNKGVSSEAFKEQSNSIMITENQQYNRNITSSMCDSNFNSKTELEKADFEGDPVYKKFIGFWIC